MHGDDYVTAGSDGWMDCLEAELSKAYEIQTQKLGGGKQQKTEGKVLHSILRHTARGWEIEADPRHAELVIGRLGLNDDSGEATPGVSGTDEEDLVTDVPVVGDDITKYRSVFARCYYFGGRPTRGCICHHRRVSRDEQANGRLPPTSQEDWSVPQETPETCVEVRHAG